MFNTSKAKATKSYKISLVTSNGNTVGFINLTQQFIKAVIGKQEEYVTLEDIIDINGDGTLYFKSLDILIEEVEHSKPISASEY
jgi:hypothetical protein